MKVGAAIFPTDYGISMTELAPLVEEAGFESLWVAEHSHIPTSRQSPWAGGAELPKHYWHALDPFVALTAAALASKKLRVATGICLVVQRDPIYTAKQVASLDHISSGRFIFGIGAGWNREEMADHGTDFSKRWKLMRERVEAMKTIWTEEVSEYHGDMVNFGPMWCWPKPVQKPYPPILLGGSGPNILKRVVAYADGWMPNRGEVLGRIGELRELARAAGRGDIPVTVYPKTTPEDIEQFQRAGVDRCIFYISPDGRDQALASLDKLEKLTRTYR
ncbi:MAG: LLM class F420-dependent oxidoreductase [Chloroflexi bacterium 13_1_40CM_3_65_12]|nr:MAG: LLM class F420-dependent oxidoreductase [Chloroflexi bacterium 13_1_40CM_65_17]OLC48802.1 MAG: LLM class F420-dependent oxidoreductase [Chloroflexi bacterium 13_1_40CM_4_65_13]OLD27110.1 MAG: LLM class F420-dependent oxidoreductase [Chloroflexi bacterium 13_1_40CM_3_65_12]OLD49967.1 MAG: LLM class F420-dependent oxidoreductase [Actinobacteria bacterium 13_1_40CM_2_65_8]